ncbi:alpha/beta fold hydrolase [Desulfococcus sp.]|uniref:alpha/beta fold hydrolase n=1 Tax=Desulfococcus sp. TaxID=2025834 RepID=UPI0035947249
MPVAVMEEEAVFYDRSDAETGPALILVHGSGGDHTHWPEGLRHHDAMQVFAPDLPGHGRSTGAARETVEAYARVIDRFARTLGIGRAAVAGHSLGGAVALTLALMKPDWLSGILLVGTGARLRVHPRILEGLSASFEETVGMICDLSFGPEAPASVVADVQSQLMGNDPRVVQGDYRACDRFDGMGGIGGIACPTLVISAADDRMTPVKYGEFLHQRIPGATFALIESAGHMMALEKPEAVIAAVAGFMGIPRER